MRADADGSDVVLLLSGGLDSTTLLAELSALGVRVVALTFDYGQRNSSEIEAASEMASRYAVMEHINTRIQLYGHGVSSLLEDGPAPPTYDGALPRGAVETYVPMRNLLFISHAASLAEARGIRRVLIGLNADDATNYWDCASNFLERVNLVLALSSVGRVQVEAPFLALPKRGVLARAVALGVPLDRTVSCYLPASHGPCGRCLACRLLRPTGDSLSSV